jgi:hypothetical protein
MADSSSSRGSAADEEAVESARNKLDDAFDQFKKNPEDDAIKRRLRTTSHEFVKAVDDLMGTPKHSSSALSMSAFSETRFGFSLPTIINGAAAVIVAAFIIGSVLLYVQVQGLTAQTVATDELFRGSIDNIKNAVRQQEATNLEISKQQGGRIEGLSKQIDLLSKTNELKFDAQGVKIDVVHVEVESAKKDIQDVGVQVNELASKVETMGTDITNIKDVVTSLHKDMQRVLIHLNLTGRTIETPPIGGE